MILFGEQCFNSHRDLDVRRHTDAFQEYLAGLRVAQLVHRCLKTNISRQLEEPDPRLDTSGRIAAYDEMLRVVGHSSGEDFAGAVTVIADDHGDRFSPPH